MSATPGWHPDPYSEHPQLRYWGERGWTIETLPVEGWFWRMMTFGRLGLPHRKRCCPQCGQRIPADRPKATFCSDACSHAHQVSVIEWAHGGPKPAPVNRWTR